MSKAAQIKQQNLRDDIAEAHFAGEAKRQYIHNLSMLARDNRRNYHKLGEQIERADRKMMTAYPELQARDKQIDEMTDRYTVVSRQAALANKKLALARYSSDTEAPTQDAQALTNRDLNRVLKHLCEKIDNPEKQVKHIPDRVVVNTVKQQVEFKIPHPRDYTFRRLHYNAAQLFGLDVHNTILTDDDHRVWPAEARVDLELISTSSKRQRPPLVYLDPHPAAPAGYSRRVMHTTDPFWNELRKKQHDMRALLSLAINKEVTFAEEKRHNVLIQRQEQEVLALQKLGGSDQPAPPSATPQGQASASPSSGSGSGAQGAVVAAGSALSTSGNTQAGGGGSSAAGPSKQSGVAGQASSTAISANPWEEALPVIEERDLTDFYPDGPAAASGDGPGYVVEESSVGNKLIERERMMKKKKDNAVQFFFYLVFLLMFTFNVFERRNILGANHVNNALAETFVRENFGRDHRTYDDISSATEFWQWMDEVVSDTIYPEEYNGYNIRGYNRLIGGLRLVQWRVRNDTCEQIAGADGTSIPCYNGYSWADRDREYYFNESSDLQWDDPVFNFSQPGRQGLKRACVDPAEPVINTNITLDVPEETEDLLGYIPVKGDMCVAGFEYIPATINENFPPTTSKLARYSSSAFVIDFNTSTDASGYTSARDAYVNGISMLKRANWIDPGTRAIQLKLTTYNANYDYFTSMAMLLEFSPGGRAVTTYSFICFPMTSYDYYSLGELLTGAKPSLVRRFIFYLYSILYMFFMFFNFTCQQCKKSCFTFFASFWNLVGYCLVLVMMASATIWTVFFMSPKRIQFRDTNVMVQPQYVELNDLANFYEFIFILDGVAMLLIYMHLFKYFTISKQIDIVWLAMHEVSGALATFIMIFFVIFMAFVFSANIAYGPYMASFATLPSSMGSLIRLVMGEFAYDEMRVANSVVTPFFFAMFTALVTLILVNVFIAILGDGYSKVNTQLMEENKINPPRTLVQDITDFFKQRKQRKQMRDAAAADMLRGVRLRDKKKKDDEHAVKKEERDEKKRLVRQVAHDKSEKRRKDKEERAAERLKDREDAKKEIADALKEDERIKKREAKAEAMHKQQEQAKAKQKSLKKD